MVYTRKDLLDMAAQSRNLAKAMRLMQHDKECSQQLARTLAQTRHQLGVAYATLQLAAERLQTTSLPTNDLQAAIDAIQPFYRFTDFRAYDRTQMADKARAALIYVLTHDEGYSIGLVAQALNRDDSGTGKARDRAAREMTEALTSHRSTDISRYVAQMRSILKGAQPRAV